RIVDATAGAVVNVRPSPDGRTLAYGLQTRGNDVVVWFVKDLETGRIVSGDGVPVRIETVYWNQDEKESTGFYYSSPPTPEEEQDGKLGRRIRFRSIVPEQAKDQRSDKVIFENPEWPHYADYGLYELEDGHRFVAYRVQGAAEIPLAAYLGDTGQPAAPPTPLSESSE